MTEASRRDFLILTGAVGAGAAARRRRPRHRRPPIPASSLDPATGPRQGSPRCWPMRRPAAASRCCRLLSSGDDIPLLTGTWPDLQPHAALTYGVKRRPRTAWARCRSAMEHYVLAPP